MWNIDTVQSLVRAVLKIGGGYLLARGLADSSTVEALIAGALALVAVLWGIWHRNPPKPRHVDFTILSVFLGMALLLAGCASANTIAFRTEKLATDSPYAGLIAWKSYYAAAFTNTPHANRVELSSRNDHDTGSSRGGCGCPLFAYTGRTRMKLPPYQLLEKVRHQAPVVHHITNWVTIYDCAQVVKTLGASPVMAHAREEVAEMAAIASAIVLNIGTLTGELVEAMKLAAKTANERKIPVVLDACGAGATRLRDQKCLELLEQIRIDVLKGNASEIARLAGEKVVTRGVDATDVAGDLGVLAAQLSRQRNLTVVITGKVDVVSNGTQTWFVKNGHPMMSSVVGTGCMAASVIGAFVAVGKDLADAAASGLACYGIAGELAAETATGPASFKTRLIDCLHQLDRVTVERMQKIEP